MKKVPDKKKVKFYFGFPVEIDEGSTSKPMTNRGVALLIAMFFLKEAATPSWHNYLMMSLIPLEIFAFLMPVIILRSSILKSKMDYLSSLLFQINSLSSSIIQNRREDNLSEYSGENNFYQLSSMKIIYDQVRNISEWPFTLSTFIRIVISIGMPLLLAFLQQIVKKYV